MPRDTRCVDYNVWTSRAEGYVAPFIVKESELIAWTEDNDRWIGKSLPSVSGSRCVTGLKGVWVDSARCRISSLALPASGGPYCLVVATPDVFGYQTKAKVNVYYKIGNGVAGSRTHQCCMEGRNDSLHMLAAPGTRGGESMLASTGAFQMAASRRS